MEDTGDKLMFQPRQHKQDLGILTAIDRGLEIRQKTAEAVVGEEAFVKRVRRVLRDVEFGEWKKDQAFAIGGTEASVADHAITANRDEELAAQNSQPHAGLHKWDSIVADHHQTQIREFAARNT